MSRIGRLPITIPKGVEVKVNGGKVEVKGPKGSLSESMQPGISVAIDGDVCTVSREADDRHSRSRHGLVRSLVSNMIVGVSEGFSRKLEIIGTGYRAANEGKGVTFQLGYSHPINFELPAGVTAKVEGNSVLVEGADKAAVGQVAANMRSLRPPEPYKGKGVKYAEEHIRRKAGKTK